MNFTVKDADDDIRFDRWVKRSLPHITHGVLEKGLRKGWFKLDGKRLSAKDHVRAGQVVLVADSLVKPPKDAPERKAKNYTLSDKDTAWVKGAVLYEDAEMIAVNKPAGIPVQAGSGQKISVDRIMAALYPDAPPKLVHRLDKDTSGVLILAKTSKAAAELSKLFAGKQIEKQYIALVIGLPKPKQGKIDMKLIKAERGKHSGMEKVDVDMEDGQDAVTLYEVTSTAAQKYSWVNLYPITGRTHQLRVHMAAIAHPIVGDGKYGGAAAFIRGGDIAEQLHLHAAQITIERKGRTPITVQAPLPAHMAKTKKFIGE